MYSLETTKKFEKQYKKLSLKDRDLTFEVMSKLLSGEKLPQKYKDHKLKGNFRDFRECHIMPDLLLIYQKNEDTLILVCVSVGSHSQLF